jgi:hypothetical protein
VSFEIFFVILSESTILSVLFTEVVVISVTASISKEAVSSILVSSDTGSSILEF